MKRSADTGGQPDARPSVGRRLAAGAALAALVAAIVVVLVGLVHEPVRLLAVLILTVGAVVAAWTALADRGALRVVATVAACSSSSSIANIVLRGNGSATMKLRRGKSARRRKRLNPWTRTRCL